MKLLLYKSNEMFSSTELIRKSKMIFDKILAKEVDKAIILRDGKPSFLLMEFKKYEKIMTEFEELKKYVESIGNQPVKKERIKKESKKNTKDKDKLKEELIKQSDRISIEATDYAEIIKKEDIIVTKTEDHIHLENETDEINSIPKNEDIKELSQEDEINNALKSIENMNFDDKMKKVAEEKIKTRIIQAREERAILLEQEEELKENEDLEVEQHIEEQKEKKQRELKEFWD